jgi:hypothetical protein
MVKRCLFRETVCIYSTSNMWPRNPSELEAKSVLGAREVELAIAMRYP